jgi:tetratricopeptide (TPR) repeat protein
LSPDDAITYYSLGHTYLKMQRYPEAVEAYKKSLELNPASADAHANLGEAYHGVGNKGAAIEQYNLIKEQAPELAKELWKKIENY